MSERATGVVGRGVFLSFEGTDASGKSTQIARLAARLRGMGRRVREVREPGGTPLAEEIRRLLKEPVIGAGMVPETELLLMNAARAQLVREVIRPALTAGEVVLADRYIDSTLAYQGWGRELALERVREVLAFAVGKTVPDRTLLLWVDPEVSRARRMTRAEGRGEVEGDRFEQAGDRFYTRVLEGYRHLASSEPDRIRTIDGGLGVDAVEERIWEEVRDLVVTRRGEE